MKNYRFRLIAFTFVIIILFNVKAKGQSLLWQITGNRITDTSYLYGTIHITDPRVFELKDSVFKRLRRCEAFASELDLSMENMIKIAGMMRLPDGQTLRDRFSDEEYRLIREAIKTCSGHDLAAFDKIKPPALISLCFTGNQSGGLEATVDELLYREAKAADIPTFGIETVEEQVALFDKIPDSYVVEYFRNIENQHEEFVKMIRNYRNADLDSLLILIENEESGALLNDELIRFRNYRITERIVPIISEQALFIAIGVGHLPGDEGVIGLLRKQGFTVEPVIFKL